MRAPLRVAVCVVGAVRAMVHPAVVAALQQNVLASADGAATRLDVFAMLNTGTHLP